MNQPLRISISLVAIACNTDVPGSVSVFAIDPATGALSPLVRMPSGDRTWDLAITGSVQ